jgi:hypothetical protein
MYRKYINIVEAANKGCPIATHDLEVNVKNRQTAIDKHWWKFHHSRCWFTMARNLLKELIKINKV